MVKAKTKIQTKARARARLSSKESDSVYFLRLVLYLILGSIWVRIVVGTVHIPLPIGFVVGIAFASRQRFQIDRRIEYALLLVAMFVGFWLPLGLTVAL